MQDKRRRWEQVKAEIIEGISDGREWYRKRASTPTADSKQSAEDGDLARGVMKLLRYLVLPDSSDSDFAEAMPDVIRKWEAEKRRRPGVRGLLQEQEERNAEIRAEEARSACIRYLRLGDYWLEDWAGESSIGRQAARAARGADGGESRASALTRSATFSIRSGDFAAAEVKLEEALGVDGEFCPALNNLGALYAHYADTNRSASETRTRPCPMLASLDPAAGPLAFKATPAGPAPGALPDATGAEPVAPVAPATRSEMPYAHLYTRNPCVGTLASCSSAVLRCFRALALVDRPGR